MNNYLVIIGTNRPNSVSSKVGAFYEEKLVSEGREVKLLSLLDLPHDFIFANAYGKKHEGFVKFQEMVSWADKIVFVIAEYNGSFPGALKAFIDCCEFPESFAGKKCCLVGLSAGQFGNLRGLEHFSGVANYIKMDVYHDKMYLPGVAKDLADDGMINTPKLVERIEKQISGFIKF